MANGLSNDAARLTRTGRKRLTDIQGESQETKAGRMQLENPGLTTGWLA
jgi:hypothetical protein